MALGKQAKILTEPQIKTAFLFLSTTRYSSRDQLMLLLSCRAGLRAKEISELTWSMVTDAEGSIGDAIELTNNASKGNKGGRIIPISKDLKKSIQAHYQQSMTDIKGRGYTLSLASHVIKSERGRKMSANGVVHWFRRLYSRTGYDGCSSHSGRRTSITRWAKNVTRVGGSLRDVQQLSGHASLNMVQRYIDGDTDAQKRLVDLV